MSDQIERPHGRTETACLEPRFRKARFNPREAPAYLEAAHGVTVAEASLAKWRSVGGGPAFSRFGRAILYSRDALDAWVAEKLGREVRSTSEAGE